MRLFIAIHPSPAVHDALLSMQAELRRRGVRGNFTRPENLHLTLAFIGEYGDPDRVLDALASVRFSPVSLHLNGIGSFGDLWWAGLAEDGRLSALAQQMRRALAEADIPFDRKRFRPHITLVRRPEYDRDPRLDTLAVPNVSMEADRVSLMLSTRGKSGMIYTELGAAAAAGRREEGGR